MITQYLNLIYKRYCYLDIAIVPVLCQSSFSVVFYMIACIVISSRRVDFDSDLIALTPRIRNVSCKERIRRFN